MTWEAQLSGKVAVITGASRGLGAGLARVFAARGLGLGLCSRTAPALEDGPRVVARQVDVADAAAVERFCAEVAARLGPIDLWINNAALLDPMGPVRDVDPAAAGQNLAISVGGVLHGTQSYARHVRATGRTGVLVNISSGAARTAYAGWGVYCAAKAAVERLTEVVALEEPALRCLAVSPGVIDTDMQARIRRATAEEFPQVEKFRQLKADGAFNTPEHVAAHLLGLAFDPARKDEPLIYRVPAER